MCVPPEEHATNEINYLLLFSCAENINTHLIKLNKLQELLPLRIHTSLPACVCVYHRKKARNPESGEAKSKKAISVFRRPSVLPSVVRGPSSVVRRPSSVVRPSVRPSSVVRRPSPVVGSVRFG